jgi:VanZ family protein
MLKKKLNLKKIFSLWLPVIIWSVVIFLFSSQKAIQTSEIHWQDFIVKKTAHLVEYFVLSILFFRALVGQGLNKRKAAMYSILYISLYGLSDEFHQSFTPGREPRLRDVLIDITGGSLAPIILWKLLPYLPDKLQKYVESFIYQY